MAVAIRKVNPIAQIVRMRHFVRRWKNKSLNRRRPRSGFSPRYSSSSPGSGTPPGSVAIYVGPERLRFVVPTRFLNLPVFAALLDQAEEEFGYQTAGGLALPCEAGFFSGVLRLLEEDEGKFCGLSLDEFSKMVSGSDSDLE